MKCRGMNIHEAFSGVSPLGVVHNISEEQGWTRALWVLRGDWTEGWGWAGSQGMPRRFWEPVCRPRGILSTLLPSPVLLLPFEPCPIHRLRVLPELQLVRDGVCSPCRGPCVSPHCPLRVVQPLSTALRVYCVNPALVCPGEAGSSLAPSDW